MFLTVKDLLTFGGLHDAKVAAGEQGIQHAVESISVLEVAEPEVSTWMLSGQLYITSFYAVHSDAQTQAKVIEALHRAGSCGLVICHIDRWVKKLSPAIITLCDRLDFPLIIANPETSYVEILSPVIERLMNIADSDSKQFLATQNQLIDLVANGERLEVIFKKIAALFQYRMMFFDLNNQCIYANGLIERHLAQQAEQYLHGHYADINDESANQDCVTRQIAGQSWLIYPIRSADLFYGYVLVDGSAAHESSVQKIIRNIAKICTLIYTRKGRAKEMSEIYLHDFIRNLTQWHFIGEDEAIAAGAQVGIDIAGPCTVMVVHADYASSHDVLKALHDLYPHIALMVKQAQQKNAVAMYGDGYFILLRDPDHNVEASALVEKIQRCCQQNLPVPFCIGIGNTVASCQEIADSYRQALDAIQTGRRFLGENRVIRYTSLGFLTVVDEFRSDSRMLEIAAELLRPLREYDEQNKSRLCQTLDCILQSDMDLTVAAEKLFLHKNTVLYRKNKIIEILGINPFKMPYLLNFMLTSTLAKS